MDPKIQALIKALLGQGMAQKAATDMQQQPQYQAYATQAQMSGQQPLPYDQWMKQQTVTQSTN